MSRRSSPQTSTVTPAPPSLMLALASPSMTTLSSWSHGVHSWVTNVLVSIPINTHLTFFSFSARYDNEFGYSNRVCDLMAHMATKE